jgi:hypothetical protein
MKRTLRSESSQDSFIYTLQVQQINLNLKDTKKAAFTQAAFLIRNS